MAEEKAKPVTPSDLNPAEFGVGGGTAKNGKIKYNVTNLTYPSNTAAAEDLQHYIGFFINVRGKSKFKGQGTSVPITKTDENVVNKQQLGTAVKAGGALVGGAALSKATTAVMANLGKASRGAKVIGAVGGFGVGAVATNEILSVLDTDTTSRIDTAIMLAIHERPSVTYDVNYKGTELGNMAGFFAGGSSVIDSGALDASSEFARSVLLNMAEIPSAVAQAMGGSFDFKDAVGAATGTAQNPFREQIFQSVDNRTFQFDYKFLPRNKEDVTAIEKIIYQFKLHMHPEISAGGLFYIYPSQFNIVYYYKGRENKFFNKISTCVLNNMSVDYGGQIFGSFADGFPTEINLRLRFLELEVLTKERIELGY